MTLRSFITRCGLVVFVSWTLTLILTLTRTLTLTYPLCRPEVDYMAFTQYRHPTNVRIAAVQSVIQIFLAYDSGEWEK